MTAPLPSVEQLHELLTCDADAGLLWWRQRPRELFENDRLFNSWNTKFAGKPAFAGTDSLGYKAGSVLYRKERAHRVIYAMTNGCWPIGVIDHINGIKSDNRIDNLRCVSQAENCKNARINVRNKTGVPGVSFYARDKTWQVFANCPVNGRQFLGRFKSLEEAAAVRREVEAKLGYHPNHGRAA